MIRVTYATNTHGHARTRYVRRDARDKNLYRWCETSSVDSRYDVRQGTCEAEDLPAHIRAKCDAYEGAHYASEWPMHHGGCKP